MKNDNTGNSRPKRGRPRTAQMLARPHRIVTFVTDRERQQLEEISLQEDRSLSSVAHRIIKAYFADEE